MDIALVATLAGAKLFAILLVAVGIGLVILVHELGHFLAAKRVGVRVEAFSIGFGPPLLRRKVGETEYRLSLLPLGGYVKMAGENQAAYAEVKPYEFAAKSVGERALIFSAGIFMNLLFGFVAFIVAFRVGVPFTAAEVGNVVPGSPAWEADLRPGDKIIEINGKRRVDFEELIYATVLGRRLNLVVERDGKRLNVVVIPRRDEETGERTIGVYPRAETRIARIYGYKDEGGSSPAIRAGLRVGDEIIEVDGKPVESWLEVRRAILASPGKKLILTVRRDGELLKIPVVPRKVVRHQIGVSCAENKIKAVKVTSTAYRCGLRPGDVLLAVNGEPISGWSAFVNAIIESEGDDFEIEFQRGAQRRSVKVRLARKEDKESFVAGMFPVYGLRVDRVVEGFPAEKVGIKPGDRILSINGRKLKSWSDLLRAISESRGKQMLISWESKGKVFGPAPIAAKPNPDTA